MSSPSISIVIPAYNEDRRLPARLRELSAYLDARGFDAELIVVDDGVNSRANCTSDVRVEVHHFRTETPAQNAMASL
jgi:cellulose synthase/poly-beta-1,6-N-acetylglucosamine synthase-like glycosyltransferase